MLENNFIKNHWNAQALDINSDGYISKQELMIASQVLPQSYIHHFISASISTNLLFSENWSASEQNGGWRDFQRIRPQQGDLWGERQLWLRWIGFHQEWMEWWSNKKPSWYPHGAKRRQIKNTFAGQQAQLQRVLCDDEQEEGGVDLRGGFWKPRGYIKHDGLNIVIVMEMVDMNDKNALVLHCFTKKRSNRLKNSDHENLAFSLMCDALYNPVFVVA